jgi:aminomethyltransferase
MGHSVGKMLALAYVETAHSWPGNNLVVEINDKPIPAKVASTPFFDPENARVRAEYWEGEERPEPDRRPATRMPAGARANASRNST